MKSFLITVSLLLSVAQAADKGTAYKIVCKPMTIQTNIYDCVMVVRNYSHFDERGLAICASIVLDADKISCLDALGDKTYKDYELDECQAQATAEKKVECFTNLGIYNP